MLFIGEMTSGTLADQGLQMGAPPFSTTSLLPLQTLLLPTSSDSLTLHFLLQLFLLLSLEILDPSLHV